MQAEETVRSRVARLCARPALRGVAAALALAAAVTIVGTAAVTGSTGSQPGLITNVTTTAPDAAAAAVLAAARTHLGQKYAFGGSGPLTWDCSGLTQTLWQTAGGVATIPRTARLQQAWATPVPAAQVLPGDLYFLGTPATHVGIVLGAGMVIDASASHGQVLVRSLWTATDITFGRVPRPGAVPVTATAATPPTPPTPPTAPTSPTVAPAPTTSATSPAPTPTVSTTPTRSAGSASPPAPATSQPVVTPPDAGPPAPAAPAGAAGFVQAAERIVGARYQAGGIGPSYDDGALVAVAWHRSKGGVLPLDRNALAARSTPITVKHLLPGDLVIYGTTVVWHVGIYIGHGMMVDSSRINGRVVLRRVFTSPDRRFGRLH